MKSPYLDCVFFLTCLFIYSCQPPIDSKDLPHKFGLGYCYLFNPEDVSDPPPDWGEFPEEWYDDSQGMVDSEKKYRITEFQSKQVLEFRTPGQLPYNENPPSNNGNNQAEDNTPNIQYNQSNPAQYCPRWRPKVATVNTFKEGNYSWKVWIPRFEEHAQVSVGAFLYSGQSLGTEGNNREIDFEICYGKESARLDSNIMGDNLMCYMTVQQDDKSGTDKSSYVYRPIGKQPKLTAENWYTLLIKLNETADGGYRVQWFIRKEDGPFIEARPPYETAYGPYGKLATAFTALCSLENLEFGGDNCASEPHSTYFDWFCFEL